MTVGLVAFLGFAFWSSVPDVSSLRAVEDDVRISKELSDSSAKAALGVWRVEVCSRAAFRRITAGATASASGTRYRTLLVLDALRGEARRHCFDFVRAFPESPDEQPAASPIMTWKPRFENAVETYAALRKEIMAVVRRLKDDDDPDVSALADQILWESE